MNKKPFNSWNKTKKQVDFSDRKVLFGEGEIWWVQAGINVGIEQNGKGENFIRPILVLKKYNRQHFLAVPLTTKKPLEKYSFHLNPKIEFLKKESWIIFSQVRAMDSKRLFERMGKLPDPVFGNIKKEAREKILLTPPCTSPASEEAGSSA